MSKFGRCPYAATNSFGWSEREDLPVFVIVFDLMTDSQVSQEYLNRRLSHI